MMSIPNKLLGIQFAALRKLRGTRGCSLDVRRQTFPREVGHTPASRSWALETYLWSMSVEVWLE